MKKNLLILTLLLTILSCEKDEREITPPSKTELLTNGNQKSWFVFSSSPDDACSSSADDSWTFFSDGTFEYDHGDVTEGDDGCGDLINFEGSWTFTNEESDITIVALRATGSTDNMDPLTVVDGSLTVLTEDRLVITADGLGSMELRKKS